MIDNTFCLLDKDFLSQLDLAQETEIFVKIISLSLDEEPLQEITGAATGGSISVDGKSSVRRTCTLTMTTDMVDINSYYWGLHTKFKLFIGLKNNINANYPDIIWFPQGVFVITNFTTSLQVKNFTINISGKDKMCYLNGDIGGVVTALSHDFGTEDYTDEYGYTTNVDRPLKNIITDAVHEFAHEPLNNIIINDLDDYGVELLEYRGEDPLYFLINATTGDVENVFLDFDSSSFIQVDRCYKELATSYITLLGYLKEIEETGVPPVTVQTRMGIEDYSVIQQNLSNLNYLNNTNDLKPEEGNLWQRITSTVESLTEEENTRYDNIINKLNQAAKANGLLTAFFSIQQTLDIVQNQIDNISFEDLAQGLNKFLLTSEPDVNYLTPAAYSKVKLQYNNSILSLQDNYNSGAILNKSDFDIFLNQIRTEISSNWLLFECILLYLDQAGLIYKNSPNEKYYKINDLLDNAKVSNYISSKVVQSSEDLASLISTGKQVERFDNEQLSFFANAINVQGSNFEFNPLFELDLGEAGGAITPTTISDGINYYNVAKAEYGQTAGYRLTDLTYAGDLIIQAGDTITSMLDKIVTMLGDYEYFYDLDGHFIFQKKKTYINTSWNNQVNNQEESYVENASYTSAAQYSFEDSQLITAFNNTPNLANVKNDYSVWGTRKGITGTDIPVHMRYAIDTKPTTYKTCEGVTYTTLSKEDYIEYMKEKDETFVTYTKTPNPNGLPEDWWELLDWANLYKFTFGYYPTETINQYATRAKIDPSQYFERYPQSNGYGYYETSIDNIILKNGQYYTTHGSCTHTLSWWQNTFKGDAEQTVYIHAPVVQGVLQDGLFIDDANEVIDTSNVFFNQDWRELIYQMALDYRKNNQSYGFATVLYNNNPSYVKNGLTGYESYYTDLEGFWRQIYNPDYVGTFEAAAVNSKTFDADELYYMRPKFRQCNSSSVFSKDITYYERISISRNKRANHEETGRFYLYYSSAYGSDFQYLGSENKVYNIQNEEVPLYTDFDLSTSEGISAVYYTYVYRYVPVEGITKKDFYMNPSKYWYGTTDMEYCYCGWENFNGRNFKTPIRYYTTGLNNIAYDKTVTYCTKTKNEFDSNTFWKKGLVEYPETLNFWFDFLEAGSSELGKYSVTAIGNRPKSANDNTVKSIYFRETPTVIFMNPDDSFKQQDIKSGYTYIQLPSNMEGLFSISSQGKSAKDVVDSWLYTYGQANETVNITALPVYYLTPNTRVLINDKTSGINGEYIINRITLPLTAKGTMSITAEKAVERIY